VSLLSFYFLRHLRLSFVVFTNKEISSPSSISTTRTIVSATVVNEGAGVRGEMSGHRLDRRGARCCCGVPGDLTPTDVARPPAVLLALQGATCQRPAVASSIHRPWTHVRHAVPCRAGGRSVPGGRLSRRRSPSRLHVNPATSHLVRFIGRGRCSVGCTDDAGRGVAWGHVWTFAPPAPDTCPPPKATIAEICPLVRVRVRPSEACEE